jgi:uncharacterized lipoprotein YajG
MRLKIMNARRTVVILVVALTTCFACAKNSYIDVSYHLPPAAGTLAGHTVFIETRDLRSNTEVFNARAKADFEDFTGLFSLSVNTPDEQQSVVGAYTLPKLFETALKRRLQNQGVEIAKQQSAEIPVFRITINRFRINLIGQKWKTDISYEASLTRNSQLTARETVTGNAERLKLIGSGGAEKVLSGIFTEMINRLNIEQLFQQAKL